jgi:Uma2 family endonuclease
MRVEDWHQKLRDSPSAGGTRSELLDGEQVVLPAPSPEHSDCVSRLRSLLEPLVGERARLVVGQPLVLDERSEPRPDLALLSTHGSEPLLLVEVADSTFTLTYTRGRKASYYARSGVPECWIVDLADSQVLVHRSPASGGYRDIRNMRETSSLSVEGLDGVEVAVSAVLG